MSKRTPEVSVQGHQFKTHIALHMQVFRPCTHWIQINNRMHHGMVELISLVFGSNTQKLKLIVPLQLRTHSLSRVFIARSPDQFFCLHSPEDEGSGAETSYWQGSNEESLVPVLVGTLYVRYLRCHLSSLQPLCHMSSP